MQKLERSIHSYLNTKLVLRNSRSQRVIKAGLDNFEKFTKEFYNKTLDEMIGEFSDQDVTFDVLQEWINWNGKRINPKTVKHYFILIKPYLHYRGIKFHPLDIKENLTFPKVLENEKHGITLHEIKALFEYLNPKKKAQYLCQLSSGMRIGEVMRMRKNQLDLTKERIHVKIPAEHSKNGKARMTFFSKEAAKFLRPILKKIGDNDTVFTKNENWENARNSEISNLSRWIKQSGLKDITSHTFRAYFITKISRHDNNFAKKLAGQNGYLLEYDRMSEEEKLAKYLEIEPELLIFDSSRKDERLKTVEAEKNKLIEELKAAVKENQETQKNVKRILEHLKMD